MGSHEIIYVRIFPFYRDTGQVSLVQGGFRNLTLQQEEITYTNCSFPNYVSCKITAQLHKRICLEFISQNCITRIRL